MRYTKTAKCPNCCPDGGAFFEVDWSDDEAPCWACRNCGHKKPRRTRKPLSKPTPGQQRIIDRISKRFGGTYSVEMIGRLAFAKLDNPDRSYFAGNLASLSVHDNGRWSLSIYTMGRTVEINDNIGLQMYVDR